MFRSSRASKLMPPSLRGGEALVETAAQRPADGARLLVDLLAHVVAELAELVVVGVGVDRGRHLAGVAVAFQGAGERGRVVAGRLDRRHVAVLQVDHLAGVADEGGDVGRGEHLVLAQAEHQRGAVAGDDELVGVLGVHHHEAVGAFDPLERADDRVLEGGASSAASSAAIMCASASVSVSLVNWTPVGLELVAEGLGVLDDAVVDDRDAVAARRCGGARWSRSAHRGWPSGCGRCRWWAWRCSRSCSVWLPACRGGPGRVPRSW